MVTEPVIESISKPVCDLLILDDLVEPINEAIKKCDVVLKQKPDERVVVYNRKKEGVKNEQD